MGGVGPRVGLAGISRPIKREWPDLRSVHALRRGRILRRAEAVARLALRAQKLLISRLSRRTCGCQLRGHLCTKGRDITGSARLTSAPHTRAPAQGLRAHGQGYGAAAYPQGRSAGGTCRTHSTSTSRSARPCLPARSACTSEALRALRDSESDRSRAEILTSCSCNSVAWCFIMRTRSFCSRSSTCFCSSIVTSCDSRASLQTRRGHRLVMCMDTREARSSSQVPPVRQARPCLCTRPHAMTTHMSFGKCMRMVRPPLLLDRMLALHEIL